MTEKMKLDPKGYGDTIYSITVTISDPELGKTPTMPVRAISSGTGQLMFVLSDLSKVVGNTFAFGPFKIPEGEKVATYRPRIGNISVGVVTMNRVRSYRVNTNNPKMVAQKQWILEVCEGITEVVSQMRAAEKLPPIQDEPILRRIERKEISPVEAPPAERVLEPVELQSGSSIRFLVDDLAVLGYEIVVQKKGA